MYISLQPSYWYISETSLGFFNVCHPIELKCNFSIINYLIQIELNCKKNNAWSYTCPWLALGAFRTFPVATLYVEADAPSLYSRREKLCL